MHFFDELKRRHVVRVGIAYLAFAWVVLQVLDVVAPILELPDGVAKITLLILVVGFAAVLVLAWLFELTPDGIMRDENVDRSQADSSVTGLWMGRLIIVFLAIAVALLLADRFGMFGHPETQRPPGSAVTLVVLPLENLMGDPEQAFFVNGMHEALITELTKVEDISVISRTSALKYRQTQLSLPEIAAELNADMVIEGSVLRAGDRVRITTQLIEAESDRHLWAENYDRDITDVLALYSAVAREIARRVQVELTPADERRLTSTRKVNQASYENYLKAQYLLDTWSPEEMNRGVQLARKAVELDPESALANAGLALGLQYLAWFGFADPLEIAAEARAAARRAVELDPGLADAFIALAAVQHYLDFDIPAAIRNLETALELNPGNQRALIHYSWIMGESGSYEQALTASEKAISLDPLSATAHGSLGLIHYLSRDYDMAITAFSNALELDRGDPSAYYFLSWPNAALGNFGKAIELSRMSVELSNSASVYRSGLAYSLALAGERQEAMQLLEHLVQGNTSPDHLAIVNIGLGNLEKSMDLLELAFEQRSAQVNYIYRDVRFDPLRSNPRFQTLVKEAFGSEGSGRKVNK